MLIGLTQRVEVIASYEERRDCLDQMWGRALETLGLYPIPLANAVINVPGYLNALNLGGVIITGGNDLSHLPGASNYAPERDQFERELLSWAIAQGCPVLGVCRGMQHINSFFKGGLHRVDGHVGLKHEIMFEGRPMQVNSYHNWAISEAELGDGLLPLAIDAEGNIEALKGGSLPIFGIMWHPEREKHLSEFDKELINTVFRNT